MDLCKADAFLVLEARISDRKEKKVTFVSLRELNRALIQVTELKAFLAPERKCTYPCLYLF